MRIPADLVGVVFARLTVISRLDDERNGATRWRCACSCGKSTDVRGSNLTSGAIVSCGCWRREVQRDRAVLRNRGAARDRAGRLARVPVCGARLSCSWCSRRRVLQPCGEEWLCRWCANRRALAEFTGKREPLKAPAPSAESRPETTDGAPTLSKARSG